MKKLALMIGMAAGLCVGKCNTVFAGHWEEVPNPYINSNGFAPRYDDPDYPAYVAEQGKRLDGQITKSGTNYVFGNPETVSESLEWDEQRWPEGPNLFMFDATGGPYSVTTSGNVSSVFRWYPDDVNDTNPSPLHLQGHFFVGGDINNEDPSKRYLVATIDNDQEDITAYSNVFTKDIAINVPISSGSINQDTGYFEVQVPWINLGITASADFNGVNTTIYGDVEFANEYDIDYRAVQISSDIETSFRKENGALKTNDREEDGSIIVDSAVTYGSIPGIDPNTIYTSVGNTNLVANLLGQYPVGFTNPTYDWTVNGGTLLNTQITSDDELPLLVGLRESGSTSAYPNTGVALTVTDDSDGRQITNHYLIRWHDQAEWDTNNYEPIGDPIWNFFPPDPGSQSELWAAYGSNIVADYTFENFYADALAQGGGLVIKTGTQLLAGYAAIQTGDPQLALLINALAGTAGTGATQAVQNLLHNQALTNQTCDFQTTWDINAVYHDGPGGNDNVVPYLEGPKFYGYDEHGVFTSINRPIDPNTDFDANDVLTKSQFELRNPQLAQKYANRKYFGDSYDVHGYAGETDRAAQEPSGAGLMIGDFYPYGYHNNH